MNLLALDTSSIACSVALGIGEVTIQRHEVRPKEHTRLLIPMIEEVLSDADASLRELDAIVLGNGPGSFIGMRIAASVAQGLCYGAGLKLVPVSSLAAVAAEALEVSDAAHIVVAQDAHMNEIYLARYARDDDDLPHPVGDTILQRIEPLDWLEHAGANGAASWSLAGAGWQRYPELLPPSAKRQSRVIDVPWPRARFLLELGRKSCLAGEAIDPEQLVPAYVRKAVAA